MAGILLGTAAGIAFAVSDVSIKALAEDVIAAPSAIISPWTATALIASVGAFYTSARSLQIGDGVAVITATTAAANLATIAGGIVVFGERLGDSTGESILRLAAFGLVIAGAALMPGPTRAAEAARRKSAGSASRVSRASRAPPSNSRIAGHPATRARHRVAMAAPRLAPTPQKNSPILRIDPGAVPSGPTTTTSRCKRPRQRTYNASEWAYGQEHTLDASGPGTARRPPAEVRIRSARRRGRARGHGQ